MYSILSIEVPEKEFKSEKEGEKIVFYCSIKRGGKVRTTNARTHIHIICYHYSLLTLPAVAHKTLPSTNKH
tara:strand:- start:440 stop:652 length:213 start_codon:yes stop_codon:yes gene_type:complete